jgi:hypothetical protein
MPEKHFQRGYLVILGDLRQIMHNRGTVRELTSTWRTCSIPRKGAKTPCGEEQGYGGNAESILFLKLTAGIIRDLS